MVQVTSYPLKPLSGVALADAHMLLDCAGGYLDDMHRAIDDITGAQSERAFWLHANEAWRLIQQTTSSAHPVSKPGAADKILARD
ncbi:hypothetical protein D9M73_123680 [compost metagenome]|jgi:hypothetical protein